MSGLSWACGLAGAVVPMSPMTIAPGAVPHGMPPTVLVVPVMLLGVPAWRPELASPAGPAATPSLDPARRQQVALPPVPTPPPLPTTARVRSLVLRVNVLIDFSWFVDGVCFGLQTGSDRAGATVGGMGGSATRRPPQPASCVYATCTGGSATARPRQPASSVRATGNRTYAGAQNPSLHLQGSVGQRPEA